MPIDLKTTYRSFAPPIQADRRIRALLKGLEQRYPDITSCTLVAEQTHSHQLEGTFYRVAVEVTLADGEIIADHEHPRKHAHEDIYVAFGDAFDALNKALKSKARGKTAAPPT